MCDILEVTKTVEGVFVSCTYHEGDFMRAKAITILNPNSEKAKITKFCMSRTSQCFNNRPISPWFRIDEKVDETFLQRGNKVLIEC
jgi:hypothetical protein